MNAAKKKSFDFEHGMERLEEIVALFDEGVLTLDEMESSFIEGINLVKKCSERLEHIETRITKLVTEHQEEWSEKPMSDVV